jgi:hypothetical protein
MAETKGEDPLGDTGERSAEDIGMNNDIGGNKVYQKE